MDQCNSTDSTVRNMRLKHESLIKDRTNLLKHQENSIEKHLMGKRIVGELLKDRIKWRQCLDETERKIERVLGDSFCAAANSTFLPPFDVEHR